MHTHTCQRTGFRIKKLRLRHDGIAALAISQKKSWQLGSWLAAGGTPKVIHAIIPRHRALESPRSGRVGACSQARAMETSSRHFAAGRRLCCAASRCRVGSVRPKPASKNEARDTAQQHKGRRRPKAACVTATITTTSHPPPSSHRFSHTTTDQPTCFSGEGRVAIKKPSRSFFGGARSEQ